MSEYSNWVLSYITSLLYKKVIVPDDFHSKVRVVKEMLKDDVTGIIDSLSDFQVNTSMVNYSIETSNPTFTEVLQNWLENINSSYNGEIPRGIESLEKEYFQERYKYSSFPILKILDWVEDSKTGILLPSKMFFVDGGSIYSEEKEPRNDVKFLNYNYFLGRNKEERLKDGVIITKPFGRLWDEYPVPFSIKRGIYHNYILIKSLKEKQNEILNQIIPYILFITRGSERLQIDKNINPNETQLKQVIGDLQGLVEQIKDSNTATSKIQAPIRATTWDESIKHLIPDITTMFKKELFEQIEKDILTAFGFVEMIPATAGSRQQSIISPKVFIEDIKQGIKDFKNHIIRELVYRIIDVNKSHIKWVNSKIYVTSSPVSAFITEEFKNHLRLLWKNGQLSDQSYSELVGEVDFSLEVNRRKQEAKDGTEIIMYPHYTQNIEDKTSLEEIQHQKQYKTEDKKGNPLPPDKTEPEQKEEYNVGSLETGPYKNIKELKIKMSPKLKRIFIKTFNTAYDKWNNETRSFRYAWSAVKKAGGIKNKSGKWVLKYIKKG